MFKKISASLAALLLLQLKAFALSAELSNDDDHDLQKKIQEEDEPELHMLQLEAHVIGKHAMEKPSTGREASSAPTVAGLKTQLEKLQRDLDEQRKQNQVLIAEIMSSGAAAASLKQEPEGGEPEAEAPEEGATEEGGEKPDAPPLGQAEGETTTIPPGEKFKAEAAAEAAAEEAMKTGETGRPDGPAGDPWQPWSVRNRGKWVSKHGAKGEPRFDPWSTGERGIRKKGEEFVEHFNEVAAEIKEAKIVSCVIIALITVFVVSHIMHEYDIHLLPEAAMVILVGVLLGLTLKYYCKSRMMFDSEFRSEIAIQMLNEIFLPMLMLEAGWSVRRMDFISQLPYILNFAVIGTLISTLVIAGLIYKTGQQGMHGLTTPRGAFVVAALISATDPVATLGTYSDLKVDPLLNIIVFGEAAINDAVAIVVFSIVNDNYIMSTFDSVQSMVISGTLKGFKTLSCSFLLGCAVSGTVCFVLKTVGLHRNKKLEILVVVLGGYLSYAVGEFFQVSGIICTLFNGMLMGKYAKYHLSLEGTMLTSFYISQMSTIMDAGVFLLSGVCCVCLHFSGRRLGLLLMLFCAIARVCSTIPCGIMSNVLKRTLNRSPNATEEDLHILTTKYLFMMWHAGLRGGIAENLALQIGPWFDEIEGPGAKETVRSGVFLLVCAYVVIFGGTTKLFLTWLGIPMNCDLPEDALSKTELVHIEGKVIDYLHNKIFFPVLVGGSADAQNQDLVDLGGGDDVIEVLHEVCHGHRGGLMRKKEKNVGNLVRKHFLKGKEQG